jgi:hypothetical protein
MNNLFPNDQNHDPKGRNSWILQAKNRDIRRFDQVMISRALREQGSWKMEAFSPTR